jgi:hypothetical protein
VHGCVFWQPWRSHKNQLTGCAESLFSRIFWRILHLTSKPSGSPFLVGRGDSRMARHGQGHRHSGCWTLPRGRRIAPSRPSKIVLVKIPRI